jgi:hypothetical protein
MVLIFVLLNFSDGLIDDETDAVAALFCCCCVAALSCMAVALGQTISHFCWCMDLLELSGVIDLPPCDDMIQSETTVEETSRSTTAGGVQQRICATGHQRVDMTKPVLIRRGSFYIDEVLKSGIALPAPVVEATSAVRAAVEQPAAPSATGSDSVAIVGRITRQQETIHAAAANAAKTLAGLQLAQKDPGPQRCSQQEQAQRLLGKSPSPDGKWRGAPLARDLEVFLSEPRCS